MDDSLLHLRPYLSLSLHKKGENLDLAAYSNAGFVDQLLVGEEADRLRAGDASQDRISASLEKRSTGGNGRASASAASVSPEKGHVARTNSNDRPGRPLSSIGIRPPFCAGASRSLQVAANGKRQSAGERDKRTLPTVPSALQQARKCR
jgi:hypothetical protein